MIANGYNLLLGVFSVPLSTSHTNMSRSEQAVPEAPSDLEINLSFLQLAVEEPPEHTLSGTDCRRAIIGQEPILRSKLML